jgi:hypothetical protein
MIVLTYFDFRLALICSLARALAADAALLAVRRREHVDLGQGNRDQKLTRFLESSETRSARIGTAQFYD